MSVKDVLRCLGALRCCSESDQDAALRLPDEGPLYFRAIGGHMDADGSSGSDSETEPASFSLF